MVLDDTASPITERAKRAESYSSITIPIILMNAPPQNKQRYYYIFWSIATLAVVVGQIYVASSYQSLAQALRMTLL